MRSEYDFRDGVRGKYFAQYGDREAALVNRVVDAGWLSPAQRRAWLADFRYAYRHHPNRPRLISAVDELWRATAAFHDAGVKTAHASEVLEAHVYTEWEGLLNGTLELPPNQRERDRELAQLGLLGLLLPRLRERLSAPDAQELLRRLVEEVQHSATPNTPGP